MTNEIRSSYSLAMNFFRSIFRKNDAPKVFVVDLELALIAKFSRSHGSGINEFAATQGYGIVTKSSYKQRNGKSTVFYKYDRGGSYRNRLGLYEETRKGKTSTALVNCPFILKAKQDNFHWTFSLIKEDHNHMPSTSTSADPVHLRLVKEMEETIVGWYDAGIPTRSIQTCLRKDHQLILPKIKLKNVRQASSYKSLDGRTPMNVLAKEFRGLEFDVETIVNDYDGCISHLFSPIQDQQRWLGVTMMSF
uniref:Predicted protein putative n=1 Tax=Albugo laibachii Nc14 TaxID=890382 RepID=F0W8H6_9STRA|nr:predicted protein putative [Albugo laibachii Nc14]|eukprot:CCA17431.1 predicted protein putative [Albugo laibachii Nc14]